MGYSKGWIEKNMGISRKTLTSYERKGFIKPTRNSNNGKYREYSEEDLCRIWRVKTYVRLGYTWKEIEEMLNNPDFDHRASIIKKIEELEEQRREMDKMIGYAKYIKKLGLFPSVEEMGSIGFEEFIKEASESFNADTNPKFAELFHMQEKLVTEPMAQEKAETLREALGCVASKPMDEWEKEDVEWMANFALDCVGSALCFDRAVSLFEYGISHPDVQAWVEEMYNYCSKPIKDMSGDQITPQWFASHVPGFFMDGDLSEDIVAIYGEEKRDFMAVAMLYFGFHDELEERGIEVF
jgi:DNA-binding transcriptional MerR regulator